MKPTVILLHGLARTKRSLRAIQRDLHGAGYPTWLEDYPSRKASITDLADQLGDRIETALPGQELIAVTHSMGGILARHLAERLALDRILMLAPPNQGSRSARALDRNRLFHRTFGPAFSDVQSPEPWPIPTCPVAVIAGTKGVSIGTPHSWILDVMRVFERGEPHDGVISVSETRLEAMADFATVRANHTWIMHHPKTRRLVLQFLEDGRFDD